MQLHAHKCCLIRNYVSEWWYILVARLENTIAPGRRASDFASPVKGTSVVVLKVERVLDIHSPHLQFLPARDSNPQPLGYEPDSNH